MNDLIQHFTGKKLSEWEKWYLEQKPDAIKTAYRLSEADEESKGIDGYIGDIPVSIKPHTYKIKAALPEHIAIKIIYYEKIDDGIEVDFGEILQ